MRVMLLNPPYISTSKYGKPPLFAMAIPLGIGYIGAVLKKGGFDVRVKDMYFMSWKECEGAIREYGPSIVGISCLTEQRMSAFKLADIVKKIDKDIMVVVGGHHASYMYRQVLEKYESVDIVVIGEGEETMIEIVSRLKKKNHKLDGIKGIAYRKGGKIIFNGCREPIKDLDTVPFPLYDEYDLDVYREHENFKNITIGGKKIKDMKSATIITSRGCPFKCQFCSSSVFWGRRWRFRSAENVLDEIELLNKRYKVTHFNIEDDAFTIDKKRTKEICEGMIKRRLKVAWTCTTRITSLSSDLVKIMKDSGCYLVAVGVESGSQKILDSIHKSLSVKDIISGFEMLRKAKMMSTALLMVGNPGEDEGTVNETVDLIKKIRPFRLGLSITMVFPETELYQIAKKKGLLRDDYWLSELPPPYYTPENSIKQLKKWWNKIFYAWCISRGEYGLLLKRLVNSEIISARDFIEVVTGYKISRRGFEKVPKMVGA